jgi:uncharacterized phage protein gp47/JayE
MPQSLTGFNRPAFSDLINRIIADVNNTVPGQDASLPNSPLNVITTVCTGGFNEIYQKLDWATAQTNILYATGANLDLFGFIWNIIREAATVSTGSITFTGVAGYTLPSGCLFQTSTGIQFTTTNTVTLSSTSGTALISAINTGNNNLVTGSLLTLVNPVAGITSTGTVISLTGGAPLETDTAYRNRILSRIANPPFGGSQSDYVNWALAQPNVTRAWCYPQQLGPGTVQVLFAMDNTNVNGIPLSADVTNMQNSLNTVRPVTCQVTATAPTTYSINLTIQGLFPNTPLVQANIASELTALFQRQNINPGGTVYMSWIWEAIALATGNQYFHIPSLTTDITLSFGQLPILGTITYT